MYFDHCDSPKELEKAISETLKGVTYHSVTITNPGSGYIPIIEQSEDQTLREAFLESRSRAELLKKKRSDLNLPEIPGTGYIPLKGLLLMVQWCQISNKMWTAKEQPHRADIEKTQGNGGKRSRRRKGMELEESTQQEFEENVEAFVEILENGKKEIDKYFENLRLTGTNSQEIEVKSVIHLLEKGKKNPDTFEDLQTIRINHVHKQAVDTSIKILESLQFDPDIKRFISTHIPHCENMFEKGYSNINDMINEIVCNYSHAPHTAPANTKEPYADMLKLKGLIERLVGHLGFCIKEANSKTGEISKEQPWDKMNPDYMGTTEAAKEAKSLGRKISAVTIGRKLTPDGQMRYMRKYTDETHTKYTRTRVHIGDFRIFLESLPLLNDEFTEEAFNKRQSEIINEKNIKGQLSDKDSGYTNLVRKIMKKQ